jgi:hypothetical protein
MLLAALIACHSPVVDEVAYTDVVAAFDSAVPSVATVSWTSSTDTPGYVEYGPDEGYGYVTPDDGVTGTSHSVQVLGLPPSSTWHFRVAAVDAPNPGEDQPVDTPAASDAIPELSLLERGEDVWTIASFTRTDEVTSGLFVFDADGQVVWDWEEPGSFIPGVELTPDGKGALFIGADPTTLQPSVLSLSLDGLSLEVIAASHVHHALTQPAIAGVRFAYVAWEEREIDGTAVIGDRLVEVADDGTEREVWNAFEQLEVVENEGWEHGSYPDAADWTHGNGLTYDAASDAYYLSLYHPGTIVKIDRATGNTVWQLGGAASDFTFPGDAGFAHQHAPEVHGDTLYLFDNGGGATSRAVAYQLDTDAWTATKVWEWTTPEGNRVGVLGDVDVREDGDIVTAWGDLGQVTVVGPDGTIESRVDAEPAVIVGTVQQFESFYP